MGPFSFLPKAKILLELARELGVSGELIEALPSIARNRYVLKNSKLFLVPLSPKQFIFSSLLSWAEKLRFLMEPWAKGPPSHEETVAEFARRRAGEGFLKNLIEPFVAGVVAGDVSRLSLPALFPIFAELEKEYGSLLKAFRKRRVSGAKPTLYSFKNGLQTLPEAFTQKYFSQIRFNANVSDLSSINGPVVLAVPAFAAAEILRPLDAEAAGLLDSIPYAPLALIHLVYKKNQIQNPLKGFGFLSVKSPEPLLGAIWASAIFPNRAPEDEVLLSCFLGGALHPEVLTMRDSECLACVKKTLASCLGIRGEPIHLWIKRYEKAIPQYELGHGAKIKTILERLQRTGRKSGPIFLAGNYLAGVSLGETAEHAKKVAEGIGRL